MGALAVISAIVGIIGAGVGIYSSIKQAKDSEEASSKTNQLAEDNLNLNKDVAQKNFDLSKEQFEYQKQLNNLQMQREDSAFQRQVSDLKAAGLSPLMVAGNGAASSPLNAASAPQFDMNGINQALSNVIGSYNDSFNRKLQSRQFALQSKVQTAQLYSDLLNSYVQQKKSKLEMEYTQEKLNWEKSHGFRDLNWKSELLNLAEQIIGYKSGNSVNLSISDIKDKASELKNKVSDVLDPTADDNNDFATYGSVTRNSNYGHTLDNENYDNDRSSVKLISEELKEKKQKMDLRIKDNEKNRNNLWDSDDYLKKHISKDNWLNASQAFIKYYLKYGQFEGHKKYFD